MKKHTDFLSKQAAASVYGVVLLARINFLVNMNWRSTLAQFNTEVEENIEMVSNMNTFFT